MTLAGALELQLVADVAPLVGMAPVTYREHWRRGRAPGVRLPGTRRILVERRALEAWIGGAALIAKELEAGGRIVEPVKRR